ncbi:MAG: hypothetical protein ABW022_14925 [Actinoplanes sp.]
MSLGALTPDGFTAYLDDVWHCDYCHRLVRWHDTCDDNDALAALLAHRAFNCVSAVRADQFTRQIGSGS